MVPKTYRSFVGLSKILRQLSVPRRPRPNGNPTRTLPSLVVMVALEVCTPAPRTGIASSADRTARAYRPHLHRLQQIPAIRREGCHKGKMQQASAVEPCHSNLLRMVRRKNSV